MYTSYQKLIEFIEVYPSYACQLDLIHDDLMNQSKGIYS